MQDQFRFMATVGVWAAVALILMTLFITLAAAGAVIEGGAAVLILIFALFLVGMAGFSTSRIWQGAAARGLDHDAERQAHKAKRDLSGRIARLVESLDEDEIVELETLLLAREDEAFR
jgi:membrane protein implicated in regulation of membrane protease activity